MIRNKSETDIKTDGMASHSGEMDEDEMEGLGLS